jgi:hypothetical protein
MHQDLQVPLLLIRLGRLGPAVNVYNMDVLADGLVSLFNGVYFALRTALSPVSLFLIVSGTCLAWLARLEIASLDRKASKPEVGRH